MSLIFFDSTNVTNIFKNNTTPLNLLDMFPETIQSHVFQHLQSKEECFSRFH